MSADAMDLSVSQLATGELEPVILGTRPFLLVALDGDTEELDITVGGGTGLVHVRGIVDMVQKLTQTAEWAALVDEAEEAEADGE